MLSICSDNHDEVAYTEDFCPVCHEKHLLAESRAFLVAVKERILFLEGEVVGYKMTVADMNEKIEHLENEDR
jgi:hypothetical protein